MFNLLFNKLKKEVNRLINDIRKVGYCMYEWFELLNFIVIVYGVFFWYCLFKLYNNEYLN